MAVFRVAIIAALAAVLVPVLFERTFHLFAPASFAFYALLVLYAVLVIHGVGWAKRLLPQHWEVPFFTLQLLLFAGLYALPVPRNTIWILAMPVVSLATTVLRLPWAVLIAALSVLIQAAFFRHFGAPWREVASAILGLGVGMVFTIGCTGLALWANRSREKAERLAAELEKANAELRASAERTAALAAVQERNRIARDIHDGLGHYLTVVAVQLQAARALLPARPERASEAIDKAERSAREALEAVRRSVGTLRSDGERQPLGAALAGLVRESGLDVAFEAVGVPRPLPDAVEQALFRTVQEALTNVRKHAGPAHVRVRLDYRDDGRIDVEVSDTGRGCPADAAGGGFGLAGLRERLTAVGGALHAANGANGGFVVRAEVTA